MPPTKALIKLTLLSAGLAGTPAFADPIASKDAVWHIGEAATVSGRAVLTFMPSGEVYVDLDGRGEKAPFAGYISRWNRLKFQDISTLDGKMVEISGQIATFRAQPEIFLQDPGQITVK